MLVNYASNMIRVRLSNRTTFLKQREFLHGLNNLQKLVSVGTVRRFIFCFVFANQNFSLDRKTVLLRKWIALILQVKFRFMGFLVKANALVSGNKYSVVIITVNSIVFAKQPSAERYLANIFSPVFCELLENSCSALKNRFLETFRKFTKKHTWRSLILVKLHAFTEAANGGVL